MRDSAEDSPGDSPERTVASYPRACFDETRCAIRVQDQLDVGVAVLTKFFRSSPGATPFFNFSHPESLENDPSVQVMGGNLVLAGSSNCNPPSG